MNSRLLTRNRTPLPTYGYLCVECGNRREVVQSFSDNPLTTCEVCGGKLRKVIYPVGIQFKGSGFYSTDRRASQPLPRNNHKEAKTESSDSSSESKSDTKSESKSEAKPDTSPKTDSAASKSKKAVEKSA